jgi:hypothetical protein
MVSIGDGDYRRRQMRARERCIFGQLPRFQTRYQSVVRFPTVWSYPMNRGKCAQSRVEVGLVGNPSRVVEVVHEDFPRYEPEV